MDFIKKRMKESQLRIQNKIQNPIVINGRIVGEAVRDSLTGIESAQWQSPDGKIVPVIKKCGVWQATIQNR